MKTAVRYLPIVILAMAWEVVARLNLVDSLALPPLSKVAVAWVDLMRDGELVDNGAASLYRGGVGLLLAIIVGGGLGMAMARFADPRHVHQSAGGTVLSAAEIGAHSGDRALARFRRRLENPAHFSRLHDPGHHRRLQRRARQRSRADLVGAQHGRQAACA